MLIKIKVRVMLVLCEVDVENGEIIVEVIEKEFVKQNVKMCVIKILLSDFEISFGNVFKMEGDDKEDKMKGKIFCVLRVLLMVEVIL